MLLTPWQVLIYNGQLDIIVGAPLTERYLQVTLTHTLFNKPLNNSPFSVTGKAEITNSKTTSESVHDGGVASSFKTSHE